jgi:anti-sigma regulatory factor (Ser/Thr protein kinase)
MSFRHEALLYAGRDQFLAGTSEFIREGLASGEPTLVMVTGDKIEALRAELDGQADGVHFADMGAVGRNPARIIPAWRAFANAHAGRRLRGIGEPIWADRSDGELVECQHHESLLNLAFADTPDFRLVCPYDAETLAPAVIDEARRSHPVLLMDGVSFASALYRGDDHAAWGFGDPLPEPPPIRHVLPFGKGTLATVRKFVARHAAHAGVAERRKDDLVLGVHEVAANSVRHAGGRGMIRCWRERDRLIFEISDDGHIKQPLVGRTRPALGQLGGHGLWLVNHVCELVQLRSSASGTVVRMHFELG